MQAPKHEARAGIWRGQGKVQQAPELLAPVYGSLRVVYGGVRHARSKGGKGAVEGVIDVSQPRRSMIKVAVLAAMVGAVVVAA